MAKRIARPNVLYLRISDDERSSFGEAAKYAGILMSEWCRQRLRMCAAQDLRKVRQPVAFLEEEVKKDEEVQDLRDRS